MDDSNDAVRLRLPDRTEGRSASEWRRVLGFTDDDPLEGVPRSTFDLTAVRTPPSMPGAQVDFGLNFGLNDDSPDLEFGVGVARRL
ncbi:hypothetical protein ACETK8_09655 [Brevundimonas staleyi]|uniref:Uncharacterized protein n=1 Tax=Brevundimonas staleyi TaxID=74326 RepID=A0ABW0FQF1_9CAUL